MKYILLLAVIFLGFICWGAGEGELGFVTVLVCAYLIFKGDPAQEYKPWRK